MRLAQARGADTAVVWSLLPAGSASRTSTNTRVRGYTPEGPTFSSPPSDGKATTLGTFAVSWEVPLFGKAQALIAQGDAQVRQQHWSLAGARISVDAEVVRTYAEYRGTQATVRILEHSLALLGELVNCETAVKAAGLSTDAEVDRQRAKLLDLQTQLTSSQMRLPQLVAKLDALLGQSDGVEALLARQYSGRTVPPLVSSVRADTLRMRPDVRAAEEGVALAAARVGLANANLWPQFSLGGELSITAGNLDGTGSSRGTSSILSSRAGLQIPLLDWFSRKAEATAKQSELLAVTLDYRQTVVAGWEETRSAFADYALARAREDISRQSAQLARIEVSRQQSFRVAGIGTRQAELAAQLTVDEKEAAIAADQYAVVQQWAKLMKASFVSPELPKPVKPVTVSPMEYSDGA